MARLSQSLLKTQKVTDKQQDTLYELYEELEDLFARELEIAIDEFPQLITDLEYKLQDTWNFDRDSDRHQYIYHSQRCTCLENTLVPCPYHTEEKDIISKKVKVGLIQKCCTECADKYRTKKQYDGTITISQGICDICHKDKTIASAQKEFGYHIFI